MSDWLKRLWQPIAVAVAAFLAVMAARRIAGHSAAADRYAELAAEANQRDVENAFDKYQRASRLAKTHRQRAVDIRRQTEKRIDDIAKSDDEIADIVDRWRTG